MNRHLLYNVFKTRLFIWGIILDGSYYLYEEGRKIITRTNIFILLENNYLFYFCCFKYKVFSVYLVYSYNIYLYNIIHSIYYTMYSKLAFLFRVLF